MNETLALIFLFISGVRYNLTREHKNTPPYSTIGKVDMESLVQQTELDKTFLRHMLLFREYLIVAISLYVLVDSLIFN